jgi:transposase-like protein
MKRLKKYCYRCGTTAEVVSYVLDDYHQPDGIEYLCNKCNSDRVNENRNPVNFIPIKNWKKEYEFFDRI